MAPAKQQRERDKLTPERIVAIARQKGEFVASWRWRDDWLRLRCKMMCKAGLLVKVHGRPGADYYRAVNVSPAKEGSDV